MPLQFFPSEFVFFDKLEHHEKMTERFLGAIERQYEEVRLHDQYEWSKETHNEMRNSFKTRDGFLETEEFRKDILSMYSKFRESFPFSSVANKRDVEVQHIWWNLYPPGGYAEIHNHNGANISGVFVVEADEKSQVVFLSNTSSSLSPDPEGFYRIRLGKSEIDAGSFVIFPSSMNHYVLPGNGRRITIAFNLIVS